MSSDDPFIRGLLAAARDDVAPNETARFERLFDRTREALGESPGGGPGGGAPRPVPASPVASPWLRVATGLAVVCAGLAVVGVCRMQALGTPAPAPPTSAPLSPPATVAAPSAAPPLDVPTIQPEALPLAPSAAKPVPTHAAEADDVAAQIALVESARAHLRQGNLRSTLAALDEHDRRFPRSRVRDEAVVLRVEALWKLERRDEARALGHRFLEGHPQSLYRRRVVDLLGGEP